MKTKDLINIIIKGIAERLTKNLLAVNPVLFDETSASLESLSNTSPRSIVKSNDPVRKIYNILYDALLTEIIKLKIFDQLTQVPHIELWKSGESYHYSLTLKGIKNGKLVTAKISLQIKFQNNQFTIYTPYLNLPEELSADIILTPEDESALAEINPEIYQLGQEDILTQPLASEPKEQTKSNSEDAAATVAEIESLLIAIEDQLPKAEPSNPIPTRVTTTLSVVEDDSHKAASNARAFARVAKIKEGTYERNITFNGLDTPKEKVAYLNSLSKQERIELVSMNYYCACMLLITHRDQFNLNAEEEKKLQKIFYANTLPELRKALIQSGGQLDDTLTEALTTYTQRTREHLLTHPWEANLINDDMLFLLTWHDPQFFSLFRSAFLSVSQGQIDLKLIENVGKYYDTLLDNYRKYNRNDSQTREKIRDFATGIAIAVNHKLLPLRLALEMEVVHKTKLIRDGHATRLDSYLVSAAVKSENGIQELAKLFENNPIDIGLVIDAPDAPAGLRSSVVGESRLIRRLSTKGIQNLLPHGRGEYITPPGFFRSLGMRLGLVANPLQTLSLEQLIEVASRAQKIGNTEQVKSIIDLCTQNLGTIDRFTSWIAGHPNYYQQLLTTPKALSQIFTLADARQIDNLVEGNPEHKAALLNDIAAEASRDGTYIRNLTNTQRTTLKNLVSKASIDPALVAHLHVHEDKYTHLKLDDAKDTINSNIPAVIRAYEEQEAQEQKIRENIAAPFLKVKEIILTPQTLKNADELALFLESLINKDHSTTEFQVTLHADPNKAKDFIETALNLFDHPHNEKNARVRAKAIEILTSLMEDKIHNHKKQINDSLIEWLTSDKSPLRERVRKILISDTNNVFNNSLIETLITECMRNNDKPEIVESLTKAFDIFEFLLLQENFIRRGNFVEKYLKDNLNEIHNLAVNALHQWLENLQANQDNTSPRFLNIYRNLFGDEKALLAFDSALKAKKTKCLELFDADSDVKQKWLYKEIVFWEHLISDPDRFRKLLSHRQFKVFAQYFIPLIPDLLSHSDIDQNRLTTMILSAINISKSPEEDLDLLNKIHEGFEKRHEVYIENVEKFLSKIFDNQDKLLKLSTTENSELNDMLEASTSFWQHIFSDEFLAKKFLNNDIKVKITKDNFSIVEKVINSSKDTKLAEFIKNNSAKFGLEKSGNEWIFTKFKGKLLQSQPPAKTEAKSSTVRSGHEPNEQAPTPVHNKTLKP